MDAFLLKVGAVILAAATTLSGWLGVEPQNQFTAGAAIPSGPALFETSLQDRITASDTTMTLVENELRGGGALSGYNCFLIDEGRTDLEYVCGTVSGTTVSSLERGIDPLTGTSTIASLKYAHRVGANVKITDFPLIQRIRNQLTGLDPIPSILKYDSGVATSTLDDDDRNLVNVELLNYVAFDSAGVVAASETAAGYVELATGAEAAASASNGDSGQRLVLPSSLATSTYNAATAANRLLVTNGSGIIDQGFLPESVTKAWSISSTSINTLLLTGNNNITATTTTFLASGTWTKPNYGKQVFVQCWGGGGGGGRDDASASGGGGGGYSEVWIPYDSAGSTETVTIGAGGAGKTSTDGSGAAGGNTTFGSWLTAYGGGGGAGDPTASSGGGGGGGVLEVGSSGASGSTGSGGAPGDRGMGGGNGGAVGAAGGAPGQSAFWGGGGGGGGAENDGGSSGAGGAGGASHYGGGAGSGSGFGSATAGGVSVLGGNGGEGSVGTTDAGEPGVQPGGGGGGSRNANGGNGAAGQCKATVFF